MILSCRYYCSKSCQTADWPMHKRHHNPVNRDNTTEKSSAHDGEVKDSNVMTELISKAACGDWKEVKKLLESRADPTLSDGQGYTALHHAVFNCHLRVVKTLLTVNSRLRCKLLSSRTAARRWSCLHLAAGQGHVEIVAFLAQTCGESLLFKSAVRGCSCLHLACEQGHLEVVKVLLEAGGEALLNKTAENGCSCLYLASQHGHLKVVKVVLEAGGDALLTKTTLDGWSCLHAASKDGHLEVAKVLLEAGGEALLNKTNEDGFSCLN